MITTGVFALLFWAHFRPAGNRAFRSNKKPLGFLFRFNPLRCYAEKRFPLFSANSPVSPSEGKRSYAKPTGFCKRFVHPGISTEPVPKSDILELPQLPLAKHPKGVMIESIPMAETAGQPR
jgi:hypothetical protein